MSEKKCSKPLCGKASPADANKKIVADFMAPASATMPPQLERGCVEFGTSSFFCCKVIHLAKIGIISPYLCIVDQNKRHLSDRDKMDV